MPNTNTFICRKCRKEHHQPSTQRPSDWGLSEDGSGILCADCTSMAADASALAHFGWNDLAPPHPRTFTKIEGDVSREGREGNKGATCGDCANAGPAVRPNEIRCKDSGSPGLILPSNLPACSYFAPSLPSRETAPLCASAPLREPTRFTSTAHIDLAGNCTPIVSRRDPYPRRRPEISVGYARRNNEWYLALLIGPDEVHLLSLTQWLGLVADGTRMLELMNRNWAEPVNASNEEIETLRRAVANPTSTGAPTPVAPAKAGAATAQTDFASCKCGCVETPTQQEAA